MKKLDNYVISSNSIWYIFAPLILLIPMLLFNDQLYGVFGENNYVTTHLLIEIFTIVASLTIAIQAWLIFPYILSNQRLYIGAIFLAIGLIKIAHAISYKGMPFFIVESSPYAATWFYIISRLTQALGLLVIFTVKPKIVPRRNRLFAYMLAGAFTAICIFIVYYPNQLLPNLIIDGVGPTALKKGLQYVAIAFQVFLVLYLIKNFDRNRMENMMIIMASVYLIIGDFVFTTYQTVYDISNFTGHLFELIGYYFLIKVLYYSSVEKPFQDLINTQNELENFVISLEETKMQLEESEKELHNMAYYDELTGLPNSRYLSDELMKILDADGRKKGIMVIEIDRLQSFKESLGLSYANLLIQQVAKRLRTTVPSEFFFSRLREGEFTIILDPVLDKLQVEQLCKQLLDSAILPFKIQHLSLNCTLNIGIAFYPDDGETEELLLKHAQVAMREAQKASERIMFYQPSMEKSLVERIILEQDLHNALENNELYLEYQPKVNLTTGLVDSVEALVRWEHPEKGRIAPDMFIPIAEESGLIVSIGEWVLETACRQAKKWQEEEHRTISVAVNLSIRQFYQQDLILVVKRVLEKTKLDPQYLELEITESMTMNTNHTIDVLNKLKGLGVKIAVDDFGTGYSSLSYLKDFPIDCLKIDRSFIRGIESDDHDGVLISMIISMAKHLKLKVVAEGVEEVEQLTFLIERHCDYIQGYLFSKPLRPDDLSKGLNSIHEHAHSILQMESVANS